MDVVQPVVDRDHGADSAELGGETDENGTGNFVSFNLLLASMRKEGWNLYK